MPGAPHHSGFPFPIAAPIPGRAFPWPRRPWRAAERGRGVPEPYLGARAGQRRRRRVRSAAAAAAGAGTGRDGGGGPEEEEEGKSNNSGNNK